MGMGYTLVCKKCGYSRNLFAGCGMMYHVVLEQKTEDARSGRHGRRLMELFEEYPGGCIDAMNNIYYCSDCRAVECESSLDFYRPKASGKETEQDIFGPDMSDYEMVEKHEHLCPKCGRPMREIIRLSDREPVKCPECGELMENGHMLLWD